MRRFVIGLVLLVAGLALTVFAVRVAADEAGRPSPPPVARPGPGVPSEVTSEAREAPSSGGGRGRVA